MTEAKSRISRSYQEYLISALQDPARAAGNIEVALEVEDFDLEVLKVTISDVVEAYSKVDSQSDILKQKHKELETIITNSKGVEIFALIDLLNILGFKLTLGLKDK